MTALAAAVVAGVDRYAVCGHPVAHSQSPFIHAAFATAQGDCLCYERLPCPPDAFTETIRRFAAAPGARGCNVTLPFKLEAFTLATKPTPRAALARACNTLRFDAAGGWAGDNTDGAGLVRDIEANAGVALQGLRVLLIGAGGAAAGALGALLGRRPGEVVVANRSLDKAEALVASHREAAEHARCRIGALPLERCGEAYDIVVNATVTSVAGAVVPVDARVLRRGSLALDMMYGDAARPFCAWAEANDAIGRDGLGMLVEQAAEAYAFFRGTLPATGAVLAALRDRLAAPGSGS